MTFNPFGKPIDQLQGTDLQKLVQLEVEEGYFVECKSAFPSPLKMARAIASLANTYGGWFFVGVSAPDRRVTDIVGVDRTASPNPGARVRTAVTAHVSPTPVFEVRELDVSEGRTVVVVFVPQDQDTPFITSDGCVYRRVGDSSEPVRATDRYALDRLLDGRRRSAERFNEFCKDERTLSEGEDKQGCVALYLQPYPPETTLRTDLFGADEIERLLTLSGKALTIPFGDDGRSLATLNVPLNAAHTTSRSVVVRQSPAAASWQSGVSIEFFIDGRARIHVPLPVLPADLGPLMWRPTSGACELAVQELWVRNMDLRRLTRPFDISSLLLVLAWFNAYYLEWHGPLPEWTELRLVAKLEGIWRAWPLVDHDDWAVHVRRFGLPVAQYSSHRIPEEGSLAVSSAKAPTLWVTACIHIGMALGLPGELACMAIGCPRIVALSPGST